MGENAENCIKIPKMHIVVLSMQKMQLTLSRDVSFG